MAKVIHVLTDSNVGGAGKWLENTLSVMNHRCETLVALPEESLMKPRLKNIPGIRVIEVNGIRDRSLSIEGTLALYQLFRIEKPDVVHCHASLSGRLAAKMIPGICCVNSRHCVEPVDSNPLKRLVKAGINNFLSHWIIAVSRGVYDNLIASGIPAGKIIQIDNGVAMGPALGEGEKMSLRKQWGVGDSKVLGYVGRLEPVKGPLKLMEIGERLKETGLGGWKMIIAGTGSLENDLAQGIRDKGLEDVLIPIGYIDQPHKLFGIMDVCMNTSDSEAISLTLLEAMTYGVPLMAFRVDGLEQVVIDSKNGFLVKDGDMETYAGRLAEFLTDDGMRRRMGSYGQSYVQEHFSIEIMADKLEQLYEERQAYENH